MAEREEAYEKWLAAVGYYTDALERRATFNAGWDARAGAVTQREQAVFIVERILDISDNNGFDVDEAVTVVEKALARAAVSEGKE